MRYWVVLVAAYFLQVATADSSCPRYCKCYTWHGQRRADCISQKLVNIETGVSSEVQVLDLSLNHIVSLENRGLQDLGLIHVKYLNFQHNKISSVGLYAFAGLKELQVVDLSNNYLQHLHPKTFESNVALGGLYLSRNKLGRGLSSSFLDAPTLKELDLSRCQFGDINLSLFSGCPMLKKVNLSANQLIRLDVRALAVLPSLLEVDLSLNPWACDSDDARGLEGWLQSRGVADTTGCRKLARQEVEVTQESTTDASEEHEWSSEVEHELANSGEKVDVQEKTDAGGIPSGWSMAIGFEVGVMISVFGMYIWMHCPPARKRWTQLETPICPDTPPPPYHFIYMT